MPRAIPKLALMPSKPEVGADAIQTREDDDLIDFPRSHPDEYGKRTPHVTVKIEKDIIRPGRFVLDLEFEARVPKAKPDYPIYPKETEPVNLPRAETGDVITPSSTKYTVLAMSREKVDAITAEYNSTVEELEKGSERYSIEPHLLATLSNDTSDAGTAARDREVAADLIASSNCRRFNCFLQKKIRRTHC